jgi:hypothetical protein
MANSTATVSPTYSVSIGNWNSYVGSVVNGLPKSSFTVGQSRGKGTSDPDPAIGCPKQFSATYQCGSGPKKTINIAAEAGGQSATFDCSNESKSCIGFRMTLGDDGNLVLTDGNGSVKWQSGTSATGLSLAEFNAASGKNGRNYLKSGEFLKAGEFIGSPTGNCRLVMPVPGPTAVNNSLQIQYNTTNCSEIAGATTGNDSASVGLYTIPQPNIDDIGKVGYLDLKGKMHEYPDNMVSQGNTYTNVGSYDSFENDINGIKGTSHTTCEAACNKNPKCSGFFWDKGSKMCYLKDSSMFPTGLRQPILNQDGNELYVRNKSVTNGASCTKSVESGTAAQWELYPTTTKMSMDTLCNIGLSNKAEMADVAAKEQKLSNTLNTMNNTYNTLASEDINLRSAFNSNIKGIKRDLNHITTIHKKTKKSTIDSNNVDGMMEDSDLSLISQNYKYLLWSILAIIIVSVGIKVRNSQ